MNDKQKVAEQAALQIEAGMTIGLGTGSTADYFIEAISQRVQHENLTIKAVASSTASMIKAQQLNLPLVAIEHISQLDVYVDGADEVTPELTLLKGRGFDLVKEKLLVTAADKFIVLIDASKQVQHIGDKFPIPVEVMPFACSLVKHQLEQAGAVVNLRKTADQNSFVVTAAGNLVLEMTFETRLNSAALNDLLNATPGIVEHGVFYNLTQTVLMVVDGEVQAL
jgi:ribose 5-phosphate isomerase A